MMTILAIFAGGGLGASLRYGVNTVTAKAFGLDFPYGTLAVNVVGSALMGALIGWLVLRSGTSPLLKAFAATGLLGGFTTFSAFSLDVLTLVERGEPFVAAFYVMLSVVASIAAIFAGIWLMRMGTL